MIEIPRESKPSTSEHEQLDKSIRALIERRYREKLAALGTSQTLPHVAFTLDLLTRFARYFPECAVELGAIKEVSRLDATDAEFIQQLSRAVSETLSAKFSIQEMEARFREVTQRERGWEFINDLVGYGVLHEEVVLHVPTTFSKSPLEIATLFREGAQELARRLKSDQRLQDVRAITGRSWIIFRYRESLKKAGWTITQEDPGAQTAMAAMSREEFIKRFG